MLVDLRKAYDSVPTKRLKDKNFITEQLINAVKNLYGQNSSRIKDVGRLSEPLETIKGLSESCCLSLTIFKI